MRENNKKENIFNRFNDFLDNNIEVLVGGMGAIFAVGTILAAALYPKFTESGRKKIEFREYENLNKIVLDDIYALDSNVKKIEVKAVDFSKTNNKGLITLKTTAEHKFGEVKFTKLNYEVNSNVLKDVVEVLKSSNTTEFVKKLASVIEKETLKDFIVTETNIDNKLINSIVFHNDEEKSFEVDGKTLYTGRENLTEFNVDKEWNKRENDNMTESTLLYVGIPVIDEKSNSIYFETETLIQQYSLVSDGYSSLTPVKELSVIKKDTIYLELTDELRENPNLVYEKFKEYHDTKQTNKYIMKNDEVIKNHVNYNHRIQVAAEDKGMDK